VENMLREPRLGLHPRPEYIAARDHVAAIKADEFDFSDGVANERNRVNQDRSPDPAVHGVRHG